MKLREACGTCKNSMVAIRFQLRVVDQLVACPRWRNEEERKERKDPLDYVQVQRDTCVRVKPFPHCVSCPNSNPSKSPQTQAKWFELEERRKRIERELDEEEQDE
jgi:ferredoxin